MQPDYTNAGVASFQSDVVTGAIELFAGDTPAPVTVSAKVPTALAATGIPAWTPVAVDSETGAIALVDGTTVTKANAITVAPVAAGVPANSDAPVYKAGTINLNALKWPASLDTEVKRFAAFDLAKCQIYVKKPYYA